MQKPVLIKVEHSRFGQFNLALNLQDTINFLKRKLDKVPAESQWNACLHFEEYVDQDDCGEIKTECVITYTRVETEVEQSKREKMEKLKATREREKDIRDLKRLLSIYGNNPEE